MGMKEDLFTLLWIGVIAVFIYSGSPVNNMGDEVGEPTRQETKRYKRNVRKGTRRNKGLARQVTAGEAKIFSNPLVGEIKRDYGSNATVIGRLQMEYEGTFRALKIHKQRYQILYTYDDEEHTVTLIAFGSHKNLFRGPTPYRG
jgi:mRNA-degrading endonuclease RelE of RelBE toxin-antitoxin system